MIALALLLAQSAPDKLPPANPLPYTDADAANVLAPVNALLRALEANDAAAVLAVTRSDGGATVAYEGANGARGVRRVGWAEFAAGLKPGGGRFEERITDPAVEVDGDIAMVWAPYTVHLDGKLQHCGYDHFDLVREGARWRVLNLTWSQRTTGRDAR